MTNKYSCVPEEEEDDYLPEAVGNVQVPVQVPPKGGLGGIPFQQIQREGERFDFYPPPPGKDYSKFGVGAGGDDKDYNESEFLQQMDMEESVDFSSGEVPNLSQQLYSVRDKRGSSITQQYQQQGLRSLPQFRPLDEDEEEEDEMDFVELPSDLVSPRRFGILSQQQTPHLRGKSLPSGIRSHQLSTPPQKQFLGLQGPQERGLISGIPFRSQSQHQQQARAKNIRILQSRSSHDVRSLPKIPQREQRLGTTPSCTRGRGGKACFGPGGTLLTIADKQIRIERVPPSITNTPNEGLAQKIIEAQMKLHLRKEEELSSLNLDEMETGEHDNGLIKAFPEEEIQVLEKEIRDNKIPPKFQQNLMEEIEMWGLFNILWPTIDKSTTIHCNDASNFLIQRKELEVWLMKNAKFLFGECYKEEQTITSLLMRNLQLEACMMAINQGNPLLASIISQCGSEEAITPVIKSQLDCWGENGAEDFIPSEILQVYRLCCGFQLWDPQRLDQLSTGEWLQYFAIYLWYICPSNYSVGEAVEGFQSSLISSAAQEFGEEHQFNFPSVPSPSISNLCVHLLKCFSCPGYPLNILLHPTANNPEPLDYKLSWLLMKNLRRCGFFYDGEEDVTLGWAGQLENYGLFHWAVFVLQEGASKELQEGKIRRVLERNLRGKSESIEAEKFLSKKLHLPDSEIFQAKELISSNDKSWLCKVWYLFKMEKYDQSFNTLFDQVLPQSIDYAANYPELLKLTEELSKFSSIIYDWEIKGQFLICFLRLMAIKKELSDEPEETHLNPKRIAPLITEFLTAFSKFKPINQKESVLLLKIVSNSHKVIKLLLFACKGLNKEIQMIGDIRMLVDHPVPIEYSKNFLHFLLNLTSIE